jgi:chemotaxis protein methyltransferase CheR
MNQPFNILILDPHQRLEPSLAELLREEGHQIKVLADRVPTPTLIASYSPDLVLAEVAGGPGLDLVTALQFSRTTRHIPIIASSVQAELEYELLDVFDFLSHPIDRQRLFDDITLIAQARRSKNLTICDPLGEEDLRRFQAFLVQLSGLHFDQDNSKILERGLGRRMRALHLESYGEYYHYLKRYQNSRRELKKLLALLTVGETFFFRYRAHFEALQHSVIPELIKRNWSQRTLRIWSAGCSTGEEPYSIAMLLLEHFPELADWQVEILATDINYQSLRRAREGIYRERTLRVTEASYRKRFFIPQNSRLMVASEPRKLVRFGYLNLQTGRYPAPDNGTAEVDLLLCRNVMIYFRQETNRRIMERVSRCLRPGGFLFLGHSETLQNLSEKFLPVHYRGGFYYRLHQEFSPVQVAEKPLEPPEAFATVLTPAPPPVEPVAAVLPPVEPEVDELLDQARQAFEREEFAVAEKIFERILCLQHDHVQVLVGMGFIRANQERYFEALEFCEQALGINDLVAEAYFLRGLIFELQEEFVAAAEEYRKALLLDLDFIMPHYNLSRIYQRLGRPKEARCALNNTLRLLEQTVNETVIPYSGGVSRAVFLEICHEDAGLLESNPPAQ